MNNDKNGRADFHIEEYKALRAEILQNDNSKTQIEILTFAAVGAIYWFNISFKQGLAWAESLVLWFLPAVLLVIGYVWSNSYMKRSIQIGQYLKKLEEKFADADGGWEFFLTSARAAGGSVVSRPKNIIWFFLFVMSWTLGVMFGFRILDI